eukprot:gene5939-6629_t
MSLSDGAQRSYQRLEFFFKRHFSEEICDALRCAEPCIVVGQKHDHAFKFVVLTDHALYILANPPKTENDIELSIELQCIFDINQVHDLPDFLSGDLKNHAQHLTFRWIQKKHGTPTGVRPSVKTRIRSPQVYARGAKSKYDKNEDDFVLTFSSDSIKGKSSSKDNILISEDRDSNVKKNSRTSLRFNLEPDDCHPSRRSASELREPASSITKASHRDLQDKNSEAQVDNKSAPFSRPLPPPMPGTEKINASSVVNLKRSGRPHRFHSERAIDNKKTNDQACMVHSYSDSRLSSKVSISLQEPAMQYSTVDTKPPSPVSLIANDIPSNNSSSSSLNRSFSERIGSLFGKSSTRNSSRELGALQNVSTSGQRLANVQSRERSKSMEDKMVEEQPEEYSLDIYLLREESNFIPLLRSTVINDLLTKTEEMAVSREVFGNAFSSRILEEFNKLKNDLLLCTSIEEAFILTKELLAGSKGNSHLKTLFWKNPELIQYYVGTLNSYLLEQDTITMHGDRADEIDYMLVIIDLIMSMILNTEICPSRNKVIFGQRGSLVYKLARLLLIKPDLPNRRELGQLSPAAALLLAGIDSNDTKSAKEKEASLITFISSIYVDIDLQLLLDEWTDACSGLLYELIRATEQSKWTHHEGKEISLQLIMDVVERHANIEHYLKKIIDGIIQRLLKGRAVLKFSVAILLFRQFSLLRVILESSPKLRRYVADNYYEEFRCVSINDDFALLTLDN